MDVSAIPPGTSASLVFDVIGFELASSVVRGDDVAILGRRARPR